MQKSSNNNGLIKIFGGILLIIGTSIGGGMLALPIATAAGGLYKATGFLFATWLLMTAGAFLILEVNLWLEEDSNMISMAKATIGRKGQTITWLAYLLLLYSLLCAYLSSGAEVVTKLFSSIHIVLPHLGALLIFALIFSLIVYNGIKSVDRINRCIMSTKIIAFTLIILLIAPSIHWFNLQGGKYSPLLATMTIMITSYGFAIIVPSLRTYFKSDVKKLRLVILIGSLIPLICYLLWEAVIFSTIPFAGPSGLNAIAHSTNSVGTLMSALSQNAKTQWIAFATNTFTTLCVFTSFLGVSLCLFDFFADGLKLKKSGKQGFFVYALTFLPPLVLVILYPNFFLYGLKLAGIFCIILLTLLPAWMAWSGRYQKQFQGNYRVFGGKALLLSVIIISFTVMFLSFFYH